MKTTKLRTIFLTALCAGGCSEPGGPPAAECDVRIAWDRGTFQEMTSVPVENKGYTEQELHYPRIKALSDGTLLMTFMNDPSAGTPSCGAARTADARGATRRWCASVSTPAPRRGPTRWSS